MGFSLLFMKQFIVGFDVFIIYLSVNITIFVEGMEDSPRFLPHSQVLAIEREKTSSSSGNDFGVGR